MNNTALYLTAPLTVQFRTTDIPQPQSEEVLIKVELAGICGTDLELFDGSLGYLRSGRITYPVVPGHEFYGEIAAVGSAVANFAVGDKVTSEVHCGCGACEACRMGRYNLCEAMRRIGIGDFPGSMAQYIAAPAKLLHKIPPQISGEQAVLIEPTAVGLYALYRAGLKGGDRVIIFGPGPIGLTICTLARSMGASQIVVVGRENDAKRLALALEMGATSVVPLPDNDEQALEPYQEWADITFEVTGHAGMAPRALHSVRRGGTLYLVGLYRSLGSGLDYDEVVVKEKRILGGLGSPTVWEKTIALLATGNLPVDRLITHRFPFSQAARAFEITYNRLDNVIKTVVRIGQEQEEKA